MTSWQSVIDNWHRNVWKSLTLMSFSVPLSISWYHSIYATMQDMSTWHLKVAICPGLAVTLLIIFWMWGFPQVLTERKKEIGDEKWMRKHETEIADFPWIWNRQISSWKWFYWLFLKKMARFLFSFWIKEIHCNGSYLGLIKYQFSMKNNDGW